MKATRGKPAEREASYYGYTGTKTWPRTPTGASDTNVKERKDLTVWLPGTIDRHIIIQRKVLPRRLRTRRASGEVWLEQRGYTNSCNAKCQAVCLVTYTADHPTLPQALSGGNDCKPHLTEEESEVQRGSALGQRSRR